MEEVTETKKTTSTTPKRKPVKATELAAEVNEVGGIYHKLHAIQKEVGRMSKDGRNTNQNYDFLSESQISETFKGLFEKYGVFFTYSSSIEEVRPSPSTKQLITDVMVHYEFIDLDTREKHEGFAVGQGSDATDKGVYKAITGAVKYIFMKTFLIPTGDDPEKDVKTAKKAKPVNYDKPPFGEGSEEAEED